MSHDRAHPPACLPTELRRKRSEAFREVGEADVQRSGARIQVRSQAASPATVCDFEGVGPAGAFKGRSLLPETK